jgi:uncharacterized protein
MQFNVSPLLKEPTGSTRTFNLDEAAKAPRSAFGVDSIWDRTSGMGLSGEVTMFRTEDGVWVTAGVSCTVVCACSLCLTSHPRTIELAINEEFYPEGSAAREDEADETQFISMDNVLDLLPTIQQYASLGIPMKPVCRTDCSGICQSCGTNLNETPCTCAKRIIDARWGPLLNLASSSANISTSTTNTGSSATRNTKRALNKN